MPDRFGIPTYDEIMGKKTSGKSNRKIDKNTRDAVWLKYMGNKVEAKCYCCRIRTVHITNFEVGHNKAKAKRGKDDIFNLRPICGPCNHGMRTMSIEKYRKIYFTKKSKTNKSGEKHKKSKKKPVEKKPVNIIDDALNEFNKLIDKAR